MMRAGQDLAPQPRDTRLGCCERSPSRTVRVRAGVLAAAKSGGCPAELAVPGAPGAFSAPSERKKRFPGANRASSAPSAGLSPCHSERSQESIAPGSSSLQDLVGDEPDLRHSGAGRNRNKQFCQIFAFFDKFVFIVASFHRRRKILADVTLQQVFTRILAIRFAVFCR